MEEYASNSNASKERADNVDPTPPEEKRADKIVAGSVKIKKKSGIRKFADIFVEEDVSNVKSFIFFDVVIPAVKKLISDTITNSLDMLLYGGRGSGKRSSSLPSKISYTKYYDEPRKESRYKYYNNNQQAKYDFDEIVIESRGDAEAILDKMYEILESYRLVRVADFYDLVGVTGKYTDNKYGWTNLRDASVERVKDGYIINLPKVMPID